MSYIEKEYVKVTCPRCGWKGKRVLKERWTWPACPRCRLSGSQMKKGLLNMGDVREER
jgi:Zn finger protein HypA/HybF involved in hydrogenase expression